MKPVDQAIEDLLLRLYRGSTEISFSRFQNWSLGLLGELVRFDAAWWGKANTQPSQILSVHLLNADPNLLDDYQRIDPDDFFRDAMLAKPGRTINLSDLTSRKDFERTALYMRFARKHRVESAVGTVFVEPVSMMLDFITLWRVDARWPFSETDRQIVERIMPHMIEANRICRLVSLQGEKLPVTPHDPVRPWALASAEDGCLLEVNATFVELAKREWPEWRSAVLPAALRRQFQRCESYMGHTIIVHVSNVDGFRLLIARPRQSVDRLGPREAEVLRLYAAGESHKAIAARFGTAPATVRNQLARIYRKFGIHNKIELVKALSDLGGLPVTDPAADKRAELIARPPLPLSGLIPSDRPEAKGRP